MRNMNVILHKDGIIICLFSNRRVIHTEHKVCYIVCFTLYTVIVAVRFKIPTGATSQKLAQNKINNLGMPE